VSRPETPNPFGYTGPVPPGAGGRPALPGVPDAGAGPAGRWVLAGWGRRAVAGLIDLAVIVLGALAVLAVFGAVFSIGFFASEVAGIVGLIVGLLLGVVAMVIVALVYAPLMMVATNGKTLGKMATGIRVVRVNGERMTLSTAALRDAVLKILVPGVINSFVAGLPVASLVDLLWPLWDGENRALHDFPVDTRVVVG